MALVSYEYSDCSDPEDEESDESPEQKKKDISDTHNETPGNLFTSLPKPHKVVIKEEDDEFLHKETSVKKGKTKISIPSLSDFKDAEEISLKKFQQGNAKKSGLLSLLPEPKFGVKEAKKSTRSLIPDAVKKKIDSAPKDYLAVNSKNKTEQNSKKPILSTNYSDSEDELEDSQTDFFSIKSKPELIIPENTNNQDSTILIPTTNRLETTETPCENELHKDTFVYDQNYATDESSSISTGNTITPRSVELDDEAMRQLCGSRKRQKREEIQIINVDQQQVLSDSREWLVKGLMDDTTKRVSASKKKGNEPTSQQKRKHQITYLAHQAKANESELQNQWANSRMSKKQTQSKYGF